MAQTIKYRNCQDCDGKISHLGRALQPDWWQNLALRKSKPYLVTAFVVMQPQWVNQWQVPFHLKSYWIKWLTTATYHFGKTVPCFQLTHQTQYQHVSQVHHFWLWFGYHIDAETKSTAVFSVDIFKTIFFHENCYILIQISLKFVPRGLSN